MGKTRAGIRLALRFGGEIINADSVQVYRGFDVGTAKPTPADRKAVPHHLIDVADPQVQFTAADFVRGALAAADDVLRRGRFPFVVGGTGLYVKALVDGLFPGPGRDPAVRSALESEAREKGLEALFRRLERIDPAYARTVRNRDRVRIIRALEVHRTTGRPMSEHFRATRSPTMSYKVVSLGLRLDRAELCRRIEERVERMFAGGWPEEVRGLLQSGIGPETPPFRGLGYRHVADYLEGRLGLDGAKARTKADTRRYAKRQMTWFRKMAGVVWFPADDISGLEQYVQNLLQ